MSKERVDDVVFKTRRKKISKLPAGDGVSLPQFKKVIENLAQNGVHGTVIRRLHLKATDTE